ncbi:MAG: HTH domain-containing protein [Paludibacteraceae bacterium]|nr:HTH domain-containing protein [Paludibacteraceae bacterium]
MDQPKIERVLRLMRLMSGVRHYTIEELAEALDTSSRSIYRYIDTFREVGYVVKKENGVPRLLSMDKYEDIAELVHFTEEEAYVVDRLLDALDNGNVLKQSLKRKLAAVANSAAVVDCVVNGRVAENVHAVIGAIENKRQVKLMGYASSHSGAVRDRWVEPFEFTTDYNQIWCYDLEDERNKLFKTSRIGTVVLLDEAWVAADRHQRGFVDVFRYSGPKIYRVAVELDVRARNFMVECFPLAELYMRKVEDELWVLETDVCGLDNVKGFVMMTEGARLVSSEELM